jgi:hypothetical protein
MSIQITGELYSKLINTLSANKSNLEVQLIHLKHDVQLSDGYKESVSKILNEKLTKIVEVQKELDQTVRDQWNVWINSSNKVA